MAELNPDVQDRHDTSSNERPRAITEDDVTKFGEQIERIFSEISRDVIGQKNVVEGTIIAMIAGGNVLLEGVPGVGKTRLVRTLGRVFDLPFSRIQFTPDLMPADVTGTNIIVKDEKGDSQFSFQEGPIFSNIVLADEINRATPKTQSALLEAMQEHKVTVMGTTRQLDEPFFVLATQNPIEQDGTYPLPEAQLDRFMLKLLVPDPSLEELIRIVDITQKTMDETADKVCSGEDLLRMREVASQIPVSNEVMRYAMILASATHPESEYAAEITKKYVRLGSSPRAGQALISCGKVMALIKGRFNVSYNDINEMALPVLRHRIKLNFEAVADRVSADEIIIRIVEEVTKKYKGKIKSGDDRVIYDEDMEAAYGADEPKSFASYGEETSEFGGEAEPSADSEDFGDDTRAGVENGEHGEGEPHGYTEFTEDSVNSSSKKRRFGRK